MDTYRKKTIIKLAGAAGLLVLAAVLSRSAKLPWLVYLPVYLLVGGEVIRDAAENLFRGQLLDETFLMAAASLGAFIIGEYPEAVLVMLLFQVGELFESYAVEKSRRSIGDLTRLRPDTARLVTDGGYADVDPESLSSGDTVEVRPGERVSADSTVLSGEGSLDTSALTGESMPRTVRPGDAVPSGCIVNDAVLTLRVEKPYALSTAARILELVEESADNKSKSEAFITRFARWYTPSVCGAALLLALIPSLITGDWAQWVYRGLLLLVVSCPCALVISVPLSFFAGIGGAARTGILVKGSDYLEQLSRVSVMAFDKTGTLTEGRLYLQSVLPESGTDRDTLLRFAAAAEQYSSHPVAKCLVSTVRTVAEASDVQEKAGSGVTAVVEGHSVAVGSRRLMRSIGLEVTPPETAGTVIYAALDGRYFGSLVIGDRVKPHAKQAISALKASGLERTVLLTGDRQPAGEALANELGIDEYRAELLPEDKVRALETLLRENASGTTVYVGDGINDAPVLARADVGVAMGALGSDAAIEAADIVLMDDDPLKLVTAVGKAKKTMRVVRENILFALGVKLLVLLLGAFGLANMWLAVFADVGVCVIAVLNALRALK